VLISPPNPQSQVHVCAPARVDRSRVRNSTYPLYCERSVHIFAAHQPKTPGCRQRVAVQSDLNFASSHGTDKVCDRMTRQGCGSWSQRRATLSTDDDRTKTGVKLYSRDRFNRASWTIVDRETGLFDHPTPDGTRESKRWRAPSSKTPRSPYVRSFERAVESKVGSMPKLLLQQQHLARRLASEVHRQSGAAGRAGDLRGATRSLLQSRNFCAIGRCIGAAYALLA